MKKTLSGRSAARHAGTVLLSLFFFLAACGEKTASSVVPIEIDKNTVCVLDGMSLIDYPGPKAQIHYEPGGAEFFCDTKEMFSLLLRPEQKRRVLAAYTQDMAKADWKQPQGHWIEARSAFYVVDSKLHGSMGPTVASFATLADAQAFAAKHGGKVLPFAEVTLDMVDLTGGVLRDRQM